MKKLMIGLVTLAAVVGATALPATAGEWFDGGVAEGWPNAATLKGGTWENTETAAFADGAVAFTNESSSALTFAATTSVAPGDCPVAIGTSVGFTPRATLPAPAAKAGVVSYDNVFYVLAKDSAGATNVWTKTTIEATETATVNIEFQSATEVTYRIGGSTYDATIASAESIQNVKLSGIGTISSLAGTVLTVTVTTNDLEVAGTTVAVTVGGAPLPDDGVVPSNSVVTATWTATGSGVYFADGTTTYTQEFKADKDVNPVSEAVAKPESPAEPKLLLGVVAQRYPWDGKVDVQYWAKNTPNEGYNIFITVTLPDDTKVEDMQSVKNGKNVTFIDLKDLGEVKFGKGVKVKAMLVPNVGGQW